MKHVLVVALLAAFLGACASTPDSGSKVADAGSGPETKRVCETVRTRETGARLRRVCREVVVDKTGEAEAKDS